MIQNETHQRRDKGRRPCTRQDKSKFAIKTPFSLACAESKIVLSHRTIEDTLNKIEVQARKEARHPVASI